MNQIRLATSLEIVESAYHEHRWSKLFALVSGGHDSLAAVSVAADHPTFAGVAHINTGIGIEETTEFIRHVCSDRGWPLFELRTPPSVYEQIILQNGFPQALDHPRVYRELKESQIQRLVREQKPPGDRFGRIGLISGIRAEESPRRRSLLEKNGAVRRVGSRVWVSPIFGWSKADCADRLEDAGLPRNPVVDLIHKSGECLCGCFAAQGDLDDLALWFPHVADRIYELERRVRARGLGFSRWDFRYKSSAQRFSFAAELCSSCVATDEAERLGALSSAR